MQKASATKLVARLRIDLSPAHSIGPGKIQLLELIQLTGSLQKAARKLGMGYKRAWDKLDDLNSAFSQPVTIRTAGGHRLTALDEELIRRYRTLAEHVERLAHAKLGAIAEQVSPLKSSSGVSRKRLPL